MGQKTCEEMRWVMRFEPGRLIGRERESSGMRFAETEGSEGAQYLPYLIDHSPWISASESGGIEPVTDSLLTFRGAEFPSPLISLCQRCSCHRRDDSNDLFVEDHHPFGLGEDRLEIGMDHLRRSMAMSGIEEGRDHVALDRTGAKERDIDDQVVER